MYPSITIKLVLFEDYNFLPQNIKRKLVNAYWLRETLIQSDASKSI